MLVPVIGLVQVGSQAMADRYTYLPLVGIFVALAWVLPDPVFLAGGRWRLARAALTGVLLVLGFLTWRQAGVWRDTRTLFEHALRIDPANYLARGCLAGVDARAGKTEPAIAGYREALRLNPRFSLALNGLGAALQAAGRLDEAVAHYRQAVRIRPDNADLHNNLAWILATSRRADLRSGPEAVELAGRACTLTGHANPEMLDTLAAAQAEAGSFEAAVRTAERAIALARAAGLEGAAARFAKRLASYRAGRPTREGE
jgi:Tfp pilus assembly protein PilF